MVLRTEIYSQLEYLEKNADKRQQITGIKRCLVSQYDDPREASEHLEGVDLEMFGDELLYHAIDYKQPKIIDLLVSKGAEITLSKKSKVKRHQMHIDCPFIIQAARTADYKTFETV